MKDECALCGRVLSLYRLKRCFRCKKLHCRSCMTWDLWSEQRDLICLNCARKIVSPHKARTKYSPLKIYLWKRGRYANSVTLSFSKIEGIINDNLPFGALRSCKWWNNSGATSQGNAWASAGWQVRNADMKRRSVTFEKMINSNKQQLRNEGREVRTKTKPFTPIPVRSRRLRRPSKTRIAKAIARAKNVERRVARSPSRVKLRRKSAYERRMYNPRAKPTSQD